MSGVPSDSLNYIRSILVKSLSSENVGKNDVLKVKKFKSQKFEKLPKKVDVRDVRNRDLHRQQVIERKKTIEKAEQDRYLAIIKRNEERENRITEVRRPQRTSNSFAFGSSTPRNLDAFDVKSSYWGQRRAASTLNITYTLSPTESTLGAGFLGRKKTDLLPTIPKDKNYQGRNNNSLSNEQISCKIRNKQHLSSIKEMSPPKVPNLQKQSSVSMSHLVIKESPAHLPMSQNNLKTFKKDNQLTVGTSSKKSIQGSTSRPSSSLSTSSSTKINYRNNKPKIRRPRPSSIAGTGISNNINLSTTTTTTSNIIVSATSPLTTSTISVTTPTNNLTQIKRTDNNNKPPIKKSIYNKKNKIKNEKLNDNTDDVVLLPTEIKINGDLNDTFTISDSLVSSIVDDETISISDNNMSSNNDMNKSKIHVINTQEEAIAALAERRRLAREEAERERLRLEEEEKAALQKQKEEEEQLQLLLKQQRLAEEERLEEAIRETKKKEEEDRLRKEEEQRLKQLKEEAERKAKLEAERQKNELLEKLQKEEKEREERRKRVEAIMLRTRGKNANSQSDEKTNDKNGNIGENIISDNKVKKEIEINSNSWKTTQALGNFVYNINSNNNDS